MWVVEFFRGEKSIWAKVGNWTESSNLEAQQGRSDTMHKECFLDLYESVGWLLIQRFEGMLLGATIRYIVT